MESVSRRLLLLLTVLSSLMAPPALAEPASDTPAGDDEWVRAEKNASGDPTALQTAIGQYRGRSGGHRVIVDLVGAIHVGDRAYYRDLNRRFRQYDVVLYELVAPNGTTPAPGARVGNNNPLGAMQNGMKTMLGLEHQLEMVDYTPRNFVHADMSFEQLAASMEKRDEGFLKLYFRLVGQGIAEQTRATQKGQSAELDLMRAMFSPPKDRPRRMKIAMASQMTQLEGMLTSFGGENGNALIHDRNKTAMDVLATQIAAGKRRIAVFYGAGHLADMDERLRQRFGLRQTDKEWVTAWDLTE